MNENRPDYSDIGRRIIAFREHLGLSASAFAKEVGVSPSRLGNWENGHRRVSVDVAVVLSEKYGLSLDFIYGQTSRIAAQSGGRLVV